MLDVNQVVVGVISPDLSVEGWDDGCAKTEVTISKLKKGVYVITNDGKPVGTVEGQFPDNNFGVK